MNRDRPEKVLSRSQRVLISDDRPPLGLHLVQLALDIGGVVFELREFELLAAPARLLGGLAAVEIVPVERRSHWQVFDVHECPLFFTSYSPPHSTLVAHAGGYGYDFSHRYPFVCGIIITMIYITVFVLCQPYFQ